jgi:predicted lipid-binding transport protein (Tim44 family)
MEIARILFSDEGVINRRQWWLGTLGLLAFQLLVGWLAAWHFGRSGLDRAFMLFVSIALLIPFHSLNAKRFRAIGQPAPARSAGAGWRHDGDGVDHCGHVPARTPGQHPARPCAIGRHRLVRGGAGVLRSAAED